MSQDIRTSLPAHDYLEHKGANSVLSPQIKLLVTVPGISLGATRKNISSSACYNEAQDELSAARRRRLHEPKTGGEESKYII